MKLFDEAKELTVLLRKASDSYYNEAVSIITDSEYDQKKDRLVMLYEKVLLPKKSVDPNLVKDVESFLNQIGAPVTSSEWKKARHKIPMTSLNKVNSQEEFEKWAHEIGDSYYVIFDKIDGGSLDLVYENGKMIQAITRGNGIEGEDIFQNVLKMKNVKPTIPGFTGNLKGEIVILRDDFEALNKISDREYKNPRNTATGLSKTLDGVNVDHLSILFYDIDDDNEHFDTEEEKLKKIESFGLKTCFWKKVTIKEAIQVFYEYEEKIRMNLPYDIDGLVLRANSLEIQSKHGMLGGNPKAKIAWKFKPLQVISRITDIEWHIGNSRRITPIIHIVPTPVGGITVSKMSGFNLDFFKKLRPYKNAKLLFQRSNDVIPVPLKIVEE
jgi:DNA ligase (NAD+)